MLQAISEHLAKSLDRRSFLSRAASAAGAIALTLIGAERAYAQLYTILGCDLCANPSTCSYSNCTCQWSWIGRAVPDDTGCKDYYQCFECHTSGCSTIGTACDGNKCSKFVYHHTTCGGPAGGGGGHCKPTICK